MAAPADPAFPTFPIEVGEEIARGSCGSVYEAMMNGVPVVAKVRRAASAQVFAGGVPGAARSAAAVWAWLVKAGQD
jgi:hypothetical protein